ncbi:hypothetical protein BSPWISOXPB_6337 [uncultured Gammaproteobacteria bacterium]|nr:hypothetical protein BSPWISOXPB_6337 [uncultured Gammaproteobacteria bacterium]
MAIPRFIQLMVPLPPLKPMVQSRRGVTQILEVQVHPLVVAIPRFIQLIAFAALKTNGSITAWGDSDSGGTGAPSGSGYTKIYSTVGAFAAVKANGTITAWGDPGSGGLTPTSD